MHQFALHPIAVISLRIERVICKFSTGRHKRQLTIHRLQTFLMPVAMARFCFRTPIQDKSWYGTQRHCYLHNPSLLMLKASRSSSWGGKANTNSYNFPNPFNPKHWIPFRLANESHVTIHIYSSTGQLVRSLSPGIMLAGDYASESKAVYWDGRNQIGETVSSGVYLYTITADDFVATRKMLIRK